jgi:pyruvate/2-oxoglutarate dehydrogenase complex dihydrolipoamide acyltransferase (E2) component
VPQTEFWADRHDEWKDSSTCSEYPTAEDVGYNEWKDDSAWKQSWDWTQPAPQGWTKRTTVTNTWEMPSGSSTETAPTPTSATQLPPVQESPKPWFMMDFHEYIENAASGPAMAAPPAQQDATPAMAAPLAPPNATPAPAKALAENRISLHQLQQRLLQLPHLDEVIAQAVQLQLSSSSAAIAQEAKSAPPSPVTPPTPPPGLDAIWSRNGEAPLPAYIPGLPPGSLA